MCAPSTDDADSGRAVSSPLDRPLGLVSRGLVGLVRVYQWTLRPFLGGHCRFVPSCSEYAILAVHKYGPCRGSWLTVWRILRCQPFCRGGVDYP
jgi:putative membrane protein insertion efficiency factor